MPTSRTVIYLLGYTGFQAVATEHQASTVQQPHPNAKIAVLVAGKPGFRKIMVLRPREPWCYRMDECSSLPPTLKLQCICMAVPRLCSASRMRRSCGKNQCSYRG